jgi:L-fuculose-phosphate aldolase
VVSDYLAQRGELLAACLRLAKLGHLAGTGGNLAVRLDALHFAVTPSAADYYGLSPAHIAVLRLDTLEQVAGELPPSVETGLHAAMLSAAPHLSASVHTHQPLTSALSLVNVPLPRDEGSDVGPLGAAVRRVPYAPSGTSLLVRALRWRLRPHVHAYLLRNHGVICRAPGLDAAIALLGRIEHAAAALLREWASRVLPAAHPLRELTIAAVAQVEAP